MSYLQTEHQRTETHTGRRGIGVKATGRRALTLAFSMTLENSPIHRKQWSGVTSRKQSPLFRDDALGSTSLV